MNNEPRATIYFYSGSESVELQLKDLDVKQLQQIVELSDLAGGKALVRGWNVISDEAFYQISLSCTAAIKAYPGVRYDYSQESRQRND